VFEARKITYLGKGSDPWWNLPQLIIQVKNIIKVFKYTHLNCVAVSTFDQSSAHEGFSENALNVNNMNVNPGGRQRKLHNTVIPQSNPVSAPSEEDTCGKAQWMTFPNDHPNPKLQRQVKGIKAVLQEWKSVWDKLNQCCMKVVGKCVSCMKSQTRKDAEWCITFAEATGEEDTAFTEDMVLASSDTLSTADDKWCCMYCVLTLQKNFCLEKPLIQTLFEDVGHVCLFLLQFHCELNPIEML